MNKISVFNLDKKFKKCKLGIRGIALKALKILNKDGVEAEIYLIGNRKMRFLNKKFRDKDKITTVLSFEEPKNFVSPLAKHKKIGEIYLNMSNVKCHDPLSWVPRDVRCQLLIHGLLHLFGYNHQKKSDRMKMEKKEEYVHNRLRFRNIAN